MKAHGGESAMAGHGGLELDLRRRDAATGRTEHSAERVPAAKVALVVVDPWNHHWCMTACARFGAMSVRMNRALECGRRLGAQVVWAPSDVAGMYVGRPQRERALAARLVPVPRKPAASELNVKFTAPVGTCMCGPGIPCRENYGWDAMNPDLAIGDQDLIISSTEEIYALLAERGITHLVYMGGHTNMCLFGKPGALRFMADAGMHCMLARDLNDAFTSYDPATGYTPDDGTRSADDELEAAGIPTIDLVEEWRRAGVWDETWVVELVRITPWGQASRPYLFTDEVTVTLSTPHLQGAEIRFTLDGSAPGPASPLYERPLRLAKTTTLRAAAFRGGAQVSLESEGVLVRLGAMPPEPEIGIESLEPLPHPYGAGIFFWKVATNRSYAGAALRVRGVGYDRGLGMRAPCNARYALGPEHRRFVALAGADDRLMDENNGALVAMKPALVFRVFLDGELAAESPVMRILQEPWRFDLPIPPGSRQINLVVSAAAGNHPDNLGCWVRAGFARP
jgi:hypothetical protein